MIDLVRDENINISTVAIIDILIPPLFRHKETTCSIISTKSSLRFLSKKRVSPVLGNDDHWYIHGRAVGRGQERTMHELFRKTAEALPLKYPLGAGERGGCCPSLGYYNEP